MYVLCLFVVLAALFITVLNSRTANSIQLGETGFADFPTSSNQISISENDISKAPSRNVEKSPPVTLANF